MADIRQAIVQAAQEAGIDPAYALAVAERESSFNPNAHASKTIHGLFQMSKDLRDQYGSGDSTDPYTQARSWTGHANALKPQMARVLGRDPTPQEQYLGHYFGPTRAARMASGQIHPSTPVDQVFTPLEMASNPNFARAGTVGALTSGITADMTRRIAKYGGQVPPRPPADIPQQSAAIDFSDASDDFSDFGPATTASKLAADKPSLVAQKPSPVPVPAPKETGLPMLAPKPAATPAELESALPAPPKGSFTTNPGGPYLNAVPPPAAWPEAPFSQAFPTS